MTDVPARWRGGLSPLFRVWALVALALAALFALRGALAAALVVFVLSPAPAMLFARHHADPQRLTLSWLGAVVLAIVLVVAALVAIVAMGGLPQVHEWRALVRG
jgi:hypothetical protein